MYFATFGKWETDMGWEEMTFAEPEIKELGKVPAHHSAEPEDAPDKKTAIILDMGEASREQGFRLNGCR